MLTIYDKIKAVADYKNMTISALEEAAGLSNGSIAKWTKTCPKADNLYSVSKILGMPIEYFLNENILLNSHSQILDHEKLLSYYDRLSDENKDYIKGEMVRLYKHQYEGSGKNIESPREAT